MASTHLTTTSQHHTHARHAQLSWRAAYILGLTTFVCGLLAIVAGVGEETKEGKGPSSRGGGGGEIYDDGAGEEDEDDGNKGARGTGGAVWTGRLLPQTNDFIDLRAEEHRALAEIREALRMCRQARLLAQLVEFRR